MAKGNFKLKNTKEFMDNLNKEIRELKGRTLEGLIQAVIELQREIEPETPIDLGNLRASWFTVSIRGEEETAINILEFEGEDVSKLKSDHNRVLQAAQSAVASLSKPSQPVVLFGYTANYAVFVHENTEANFKRSGAKVRWLYAGLQRAKKQMLEKIRQHAKF